jgi:hypothetical protein
MSYQTGRHVHAIQECFQQWGQIQGGHTGARWDLRSNNVPDLLLHAHAFEDWLLIHADACGPVENLAPWEALIWNGRIDGAARLFFKLPEQMIGVRAEIPLVDEGGIVPDLVATLAGFEQAASLVQDPSSRETNAESQPNHEESDQESGPTTAQFLVETGWPFTERARGSYMVELENKGDFYQALVETRPDGSHMTSVELVARDTFECVSREALALLLLTASGVIRMVRPVVEDFNGRITARFEIQFSAGADAAFLDRVLSSLSVACRLCGREAAVLNNLRVAGKYLAVRNFTNE